MDVLEVKSTITTVSGEEDKAYGEFRVTVTGTECEMNCFKDTIGDYAKSMCDLVCGDCCDNKESSSGAKGYPIFGGAFYDEYDNLVYIEKVVYNKKKRTTVVIWNDGVVTKSVCHEKDAYNREMGLLLATMKRLTNSDFTTQLLEDWSTEDDEDVIEVTLKDVRQSYKQVENNLKKLAQINKQERGDK